MNWLTILFRYSLLVRKWDLNLFGFVLSEKLLDINSLVLGKLSKSLVLSKKLNILLSAILMDILGLVVVSNDSSKLLLVLGNSSFNLLHANDFFALLLVSSLLESLHLFVNKVNNLILVVVSESENLLIISSFVVKLDVLLFKCKQGSSDFVDKVE